jgi:malonate transporter and related proteins
VNFAQLLFPDFSLILCGYLVCRYTALDRSVWEKVDALVFFLLFPVLLFHSIVKNPLDLKAASGLIVAGLTLGGMGIALSYCLPFVPGLRKHIDTRQHAASAQVGFRFNSFIALALADRLAGSQGVLLIAVLIGTCVPVFGVAAVWPMARNSQQGLAKSLLQNPLIIATSAGLAANLAGFSIPAWLEPTGLMAAGAGMQFAALPKAKVLAVALLAIRHFILPLLAWGLSRLLGLSDTQTTVLLAFSALPTASSCYVLAARMGYDGAYVAGLVTLSTLLGMLSLPFALGVLK